MLGGFPTVTGELASGRRRALRIARPAGGTFTEKMVPADIPPGKTLRVGLSLTNMSRIRSGSTLRYVVTISNPHATPVYLRRCPSYTEGLAAERNTSVQRSSLLNCESIHVIGPHRQVRYAMELAIRPASVTLAKVYWHLNTPNEPAAVAVVVIDPAGSG
jgi:hypothetical protein